METPTATGRGDPVLAQRLADQVRDLSIGDAIGRLRLLMAAHVVDPDNPAHQAALAEALLGSDLPSVITSVAPSQFARSRLDVAGSITYAAVSAEGSYLLTSGTTGSHLWQARLVTGEWGLRLVESLDTPVGGAAAAGNVLTSTFVLAQTNEVWQWIVTNPQKTRRSGPIGAHADAAAITTDGQVAVVAEGTTGTVWQVGTLRPEAQGALTYRRAVTVLAFAPESTMLAAGHDDGSVTTQSIDVSAQQADERILTSANGPVDAVAAATNGSTALAVHASGTVTVWDLTVDRSEPVGTATSSVRPGPHRAWLSTTGDFAVIADPTGGLTLLSLKDRARPKHLHTITPPDGAAVPAMITSDGRVAMTVDRDNTLTVWNLDPVLKVIENPTELACRVTGLTHEEWRRMVPNEAYNNPCKPPPLPTFNKGSGTPPSPGS